MRQFNRLFGFFLIIKGNDFRSAFIFAQRLIEIRAGIIVKGLNVPDVFFAAFQPSVSRSRIDELRVINDILFKHGISGGNDLIRDLARLNLKQGQMIADAKTGKALHHRRPLKNQAAFIQHRFAVKGR